MSQKTGPRIIVHQDSAIRITNDGVNPISTLGSNWEFDVSSSTSWEIAKEDYIDLRGFVPDEMTFTVADVVYQNSSPPIWNDYAAVAANRNQLFLTHQVYVTTSPIAQGVANNIFSPIVPGFLVFNADGVQEIQGLSPSEVIYGHIATYQSVNTINHAIYAFTQTNFNSFGLGKPIVADRLYVYHNWQLTSVDDIIAGSRPLLGILECPADNIVLVGQAEEEPDYMYLHRMAQQYQLQQNYDGD